MMATSERTVVTSLADVPQFATEDEEREWWATHDLAPDLWEDVPEEHEAWLKRLREQRRRVPSARPTALAAS
jgi:hypothetical protein